MIFRNPLLWTEEISRYSYIWCVFLCISMGEHYGDHFCVDIFLKWLKGRPNKIVYAVEKLIAFLCYVYVFVWSLKFYNFEKILSSPALGMPLGIIAAALVVGFFFSAVRTGTHFVRLVKEAIEYKEEKEVKA